MRSRDAVLSVGLVLALMAPAIGDDKSGPPVGEAAPTFDVNDITGPNKGKALCYV
jgi:hypothetical protein